MRDRFDSPLIVEVTDDDLVSDKERLKINGFGMNKKNATYQYELFIAGEFDRCESKRRTIQLHCFEYDFTVTVDRRISELEREGILPYCTQHNLRIGLMRAVYKGED